MNDLIESPVSINSDDLKVFDEVDEIVSRSLMTGDPLMAFEHGNGLIRVSKLKGYALAKLLFKLDRQWDLFQSSGMEDDLKTMAYVHMGIKPATTEKYINMWEAIFENEGIDDETKHLLSGRNIGDTLLLTAAARDGSLDPIEMKEAALAPDRSSLRKIIRDKRGEKTSSGTATMLYLAMRDTSRRKAGTIYVKRGDVYEDIAVLLPTASDAGERGRAKLLNGVEEVY